MILVTGGAGFIGSNFILNWIAVEKTPVIVLDKLTYAGNRANLESLNDNPLLNFIEGDINDRSLVDALLDRYQPSAILNFAAESHVDRSITKPDEFITTNVNGTFCLLEAARCYWSKLSLPQQKRFRFFQISTDEVYGSLLPDEPSFTEKRAYSPNNPYSASKAAADHLVNAYYHTYGLPTLISNCSNNYGAYQFPEKLIPLVIYNAINNLPIFIYGDGLQIRDWLYVTDHCNAIRMILSSASIGEVYNIGGHCEKTNLSVVQTICSILDDIHPNSSLNKSYASLITHISDRPGHDKRYAINAQKIKDKIGWMPAETFETGIRKTVGWYLENLGWIKDIHVKKEHKDWLERNYNKRGVEVL